MGRGISENALGANREEMNGRQIRVRLLLGVVCCLWAGLMSAGEGGSIDDLRATLRTRIVEGVKAKREARISVRMLGMRVRALIVDAGNAGVRVDAGGGEETIEWSALSDVLLYSAARQLIDDTVGGEHMALAQFAIASGWQEKAIGELYQAQEVDPGLIDTAKRLIAELEGRTVVQRPVAQIKAPVPKPKPRPEGRAVQYAPGPADMEPLVPAGAERTAAPDWAAAELDFFNAVEEALGAFVDKFVEPSGAACVHVNNSGTADDIVEGVATWDRYLVMAGSDKVRNAYRSIWLNVYSELERVRNGFRNGYYSGGYDAEHAGELLQHLWGCLDVFPQDQELIKQNRLAAEAIYSGIEQKTGLFKSLYLSASGGRGGEHAGKCSGHDFVYLNAFFQEYIRSGDPKYRVAILRFGEAMNRVTERTGGVIPCTVNTDGSLPQQWWLGPFDYAQWGLPGVGQRGWHAYLSMAAFLTGGDVRTLRGIRSTVRVLFEQGGGNAPALNFNGQNWGKGDNWQVRHIVERLYDLCWDDETKKWMQMFGSGPGRFFYFGGGGTGQPAASFGNRSARWRQEAERLRNTSRKPSTGDELTEAGPRLYYAFPYVDGNWWSQGYDNGRCGGVVNSPVRYFHEDGRTGLPEGVAAVVSHVERDWFRLHLFNSKPESVRMWISGGFYGQHRIEAIKSGSALAQVGSPRVLLGLPPNFETQLDVIIVRCAYRPDAYPWKYRGLPAETLPQDRDLRVMLRIPF